jgi:hypothetical protein
LTPIVQIFQKTSLEGGTFTQQFCKVLLAEEEICIARESVMTVDRKSDRQLSARSTADVQIAEEREDVDHGAKGRWRERLLHSPALLG